MKRMNVDRMFRQLYIHHDVSVSSSQFCRLAPGTRTCRREECMTWKDQRLVRIPSDSGLQVFFGAVLCELVAV